MTDYDRGRNDGLILGIATKGVLTKERGSPEEGLKSVGGAEYEVIGTAKILNYAKGDG